MENNKIGWTDDGRLEPTEKEETLSDKIIDGEDVYWNLEGGNCSLSGPTLILKENVKKAVKKLKGIDLIKMAQKKVASKESFNINQMLKKEIDKIVGDKLI